MKKNDEDLYLDQLLSSYREEPVSDLQIQKWKKAVRSQVPHRQRRSWQWAQLVAAGLVGFIVGSLFFHSRANQIPVADGIQNDTENATIEYVVTKSD